MVVVLSYILIHGGGYTVMENKYIHIYNHSVFTLQYLSTKSPITKINSPAAIQLTQNNVVQ